MNFLNQLLLNNPISSFVFCLISLNVILSVKSFKFTPVQDQIPIHFDSDCFMSTVFESAVTLSDKFHWNMQYSGSSGVILTRTIYDVRNYDFAFDEQDEDDLRMTINTKFLKFIGKYGEPCMGFLLLTETFNSTATAIHQSGYGTSNDVLFLVNGSATEIVQEFNKDISESNLEFSFNAPIVFYSTSKISTYCYFWPRGIEKCHDIPEQVTGRWSYSSILRSIQLHSNNGYGYNASLYIGTNPEWEIEDLIGGTCVTSENEMFYRNVQSCHYAEIVILRELGYKFNLSFLNIKGFSEDDGDNDWHLQVKWNEMMRMTVRNVLIQKRGSHLILQQSNIKLVYCSKKSEIEHMNWHIYVTNFSYAIWCWILLIPAVFAFIYGSILKGIDILWPFFGLHFWTKHPKKFLILYMVPMVFLSAHYDGQLSTDFIHMKTPKDTPDLFQLGYKLWSDEIVLAERYFEKLKLEFEGQVKVLTGGRSFRELFYNLAHPNYTLPNRNDAINLVGNMSERKIILSTGIANIKSIAQIFVYTNRDIIIEGSGVICGRLPIHDGLNIRDTNSLRIWGHTATQFSALFVHWVEMGFLKRMQDLMNFKKALIQPLKWSEALLKVSEEAAFKVNSPLGIACLAQVVSSAVILLLSFLHMTWGKNGQRFIARIASVTDKIKDKLLSIYETIHFMIRKG